MAQMRFLMELVDGFPAAIGVPAILRTGSKFSLHEEHAENHKGGKAKEGKDAEELAHGTMVFGNNCQSELIPAE